MAKKVVKKCKHLNVTLVDLDQVAENRVYNDAGDIVEYDDYKLFIFNCNECGEIVVKKLLRSHFKADIKKDDGTTG